MVREDRVIMSVKELRRVHVIRQTMEKQMTQVKAGGLLGLTPRQIRRLIKRVPQAGDHGLAHRGRGKPLNRHDPGAGQDQGAKAVREAVWGLWPDVGGGEAGRAARDGSAERKRCGAGSWRRGLTHFQRRKRPHRAWRERKAHVGELVQLDGSHHDWFEGRGSRCVLMAYIDDASSRVFARFYEYEGTIPAMDSCTCYVTRYGIPLAVYADKHMT